MNIKKKMRTALVLVLCVSMLLGAGVPGHAAQKITNPGGTDGVDGIDANPAVGVHNSYAWCAEVFSQTDADYLWVGMNRDMGAFLMGNAGVPNADGLVELAGIPPVDTADRKGKIYRQRCADNDAGWELMYENPAISGWRRMLVFNGDLYVWAGLTNLSVQTPQYFYSIIVRFKADFKKGDTPEIVFWEVVPTDGSTPEYFRSATVLDGKLYVGTFDCKIFVTDGTGLSNQTPAPPAQYPQFYLARATGWQLFMDLKTQPLFETAADSGYVYIKDSIWDMIGFNGYLYVFAINMGFRVYKIKPVSVPEVRVIVGENAAAKYPPGMGIPQNMSGSGFRSAAFDKDYIYVSTFANGPGLMGNMAGGKFDIFFNQFAPSQIYRFDANDNWEAVVADTSGEFAPKDKDGNVIQRVGNQRSGFYPGAITENASMNQYIWWMAEYGGKLYASTWDLGVFRSDFRCLFMLVNTIVGTLGEDGAALIEELLPLAFNWDTPFLELITIPFRAIPVTFKIIWLMFKRGVILDLIPLLFNVIRVFFNFQDPGGFDVFVSEDGVNFSPVTLDGFGDEKNYGGRVLLPSPYGMFVCTANPFGGGQVWRLDEIKDDLQINIPAVIHLKVGETFKGSARSLNFNGLASIELDAACDIAGITIAKRSSGAVKDRTSSIRNILGQYFETGKETEHPTTMYDVVLTGTAPGTREVKLAISVGGAGGAIAEKTVTVVVD